MSSQSYVMVSQSSPSLNTTHPFISSPDSANVTPTTSVPPTSNASSRHESRSAYYPPALKVEPNTHANQQPDFDLNSLSASTQTSGESGEHDSSQVPMKPILETDGVVSAEVGDVPGILHQDLHPDGQPRRPMNAFMIFARHRRPAIQSKEPGLKTGEISKRLSHDWKNLPEEDKSHYLEQAKLLKDEFHSRFPEYVYKRRPNNTGKRRSSTSQQQLHSKYACGPGGVPSMHGPISGGLPHPGDVHSHHYHHLHPPHGELYGPGHPHLPHHHHMQPPSRPLSAIAQHSPKLGPFYPPPANPTSPRYHHIAQAAAGSNCAPLVSRHQAPYACRGPPPPTNTTATVAPSTIHSPRPSSPGSSSAAPNGLSYMRLSNPHTMTYHAPPPSSNHYSWFPNENSYSSSSGHHVSQSQAPLSANRPSFHYSSWSASVPGDPHMPGSGLDAADGSDANHAINHSRAASYSAGPPIYRPASPVDRGRQLSLPSHSLSSSAADASPNGHSESGSLYPDRSHSDSHSSPLGIQNANHHNYGPYPPPEILNSGSRPAYSATTSASSGFNSASVRNSLVSGVNGPQTTSDAHGAFDTHRSPIMNQSHNSSASQSSKNGFVTHCSPLHHPTQPAPPPPPAPSSTHHHQHSSGNSAPATSATSVAY